MEQEIKAIREKEDDKKEKENQPKKPSGCAGKFMGIFLFTCIFAAGLFLLWAWISYHRRYSAGLVRAGLVLVYILPCLLGGRLVRAFMGGKKLLFGAALGGCFYAAVLLLSVLVKGTALQEGRLSFAPLVLCTVCGIAGTLRLRQKREKEP